mmetsp:Transcript_1739/g.3600  ORF Transcript_1739/g.3600 Transcript_1739/m.3600 type:complete len:98 (+) Transcript_1739:1537-1830(+)
MMSSVDTKKRMGGPARIRDTAALCFLVSPPACAYAPTIFVTAVTAKAGLMIAHKSETSWTPTSQYAINPNTHTQAEQLNNQAKRAKIGSTKRQTRMK